MIPRPRGPPGADPGAHGREADDGHEAEAHRRADDGPDLQGPLPVVDDNRKVVGALSVVGATIVKIVSKFQYYFPDFLKKSEFP